MAEASPLWLRERERGSRFGLWLMRFLATRAPAPALDALIWSIALFYTLSPRRTVREGASAYFRALVGREPTFRERHRQIRYFAHVILERVGLLSGREGYRITSTGEGLVSALHGAGRGAVLLGAHFGSFEALRAFDRTLPGLKVRYLMRDDNSELSTTLLNELNPELAARVIPLRDGIEAMMAAREALSRGEFVAFLGDRVTGENPRAALEVTFLGRPMKMPRAPYLCALLAEVPILLCFAPRTGRRQYEIHFSELHDGRPVARGERDARCASLAQSYADALAEMCRRHPCNWFNFFDVWR